MDKLLVGATIVTTFPIAIGAARFALGALLRVMRAGLN
jgi:hypothetical protein